MQLKAPSWPEDQTLQPMKIPNLFSVLAAVGLALLSPPRAAAGWTADASLPFFFQDQKVGFAADLSYRARWASFGFDFLGQQSSNRFDNPTRMKTTSVNVRFYPRLFPQKNIEPYGGMSLGVARVTTRYPAIPGIPGGYSVTGDNIALQFQLGVLVPVGRLPNTKLKLGWRYLELAGWGFGLITVHAGQAAEIGLAHRF
jgi:opacity protein-like surface antigen